MLTREQLQRAASDTGFPIDSLEKVSMLVRLLTTDSAFQRRIEASPGLQSKAFNVKTHAELGE